MALLSSQIFVYRCNTYAKGGYHRIPVELLPEKNGNVESLHRYNTVTVHGRKFSVTVSITFFCNAYTPRVLMHIRTVKTEESMCIRSISPESSPSAINPNIMATA